MVVISDHYFKHRFNLLFFNGCFLAIYVCLHAAIVQNPDIVYLLYHGT